VRSNDALEHYRSSFSNELPCNAGTDRVGEAKTESLLAGEVCHPEGDEFAFVDNRLAIESCGIICKIARSPASYETEVNLTLLVGSRMSRASSRAVRYRSRLRLSAV